MINRERILSLAVAIREHAEILEGFAIAPDSTPYMLEKEALGRANLIEGRLAQLRDAASLPELEPFPNLHRAPVTTTTGRANVRVLGDRSPVIAPDETVRIEKGDSPPEDAA